MKFIKSYKLFESNEFIPNLIKRVGEDYYWVEIKDNKYYCYLNDNKDINILIVDSKNRELFYDFNLIHINETDFNTILYYVLLIYDGLKQTFNNTLFNISFYLDINKIELRERLEEFNVIESGYVIYYRLEQLFDFYDKKDIPKSLLNEFHPLKIKY